MTTAAVSLLSGGFTGKGQGTTNATGRSLELAHLPTFSHVFSLFLLRSWAFTARSPRQAPAAEAVAVEGLARCRGTAIGRSQCGHRHPGTANATGRNHCPVRDQLANGLNS